MPQPPKPLVWICALLACLGMARIMYYEVWVDRSCSRGQRIDARYAPLRPLLSPNGRFGYLTDERFARPLDSKRYTQALFGLAPRILILDAPDADLWVADLGDPLSLDSLAAKRGLEATARFDEGQLVLLRRRQPQ